MPNQTLKPIALDATKLAFDAARRALGDVEIIGYAILTHDTANSCQPVFATDRGAESFRAGTRQEFLFSPDNWDYFAHGSLFGEFNEQIELIYDAGDYEVDEDWHDKFRIDVFESCMFALESLVSDGYFDQLECPARPFVTLGVSEFSVWHETAWGAT